MNDPIQNIALLFAVQDNPSIQAAWLDHGTNPPTLHLRTTGPPRDQDPNALPLQNHEPLLLHPQLQGLPAVIKTTRPLHDLRLPLPLGTPFNAHQDCQDEPVQMGTQLQPAGGNWVGTAGLPIKWIDKDANPHWGVLSNWHVMCTASAKKRHPQHQPTVANTPIAFLADWNAITPSGTHYLDAAIADAYRDGFHTISNQILGIGQIGDHTIEAKVGLDVIKSGRTTAVTIARCTAIGAVVKIGYDGFTATFADQDVFEDTGGHFSQPGDSGSAILGASCLCPCSLLFAGGGNLTIGNPMRYASTRFDLAFPF